MSSPSTIAALRSLVAAWNPPARPPSAVPTGVRAIDELLGGGLPTGQLTEVVCAPGTGGQSVLAQLLETTRAARQRVALIDAADAFAPEAVPLEVLRHLVWARCRHLTEALAAADVLLRDGNYAVVLLDLRDVPASALNRTPSTRWHRLHRVAERQPAAVAVFSRSGLVPAVRWRLELGGRRSLAGPRQTRGQWLEDLPVQVSRGFLAEELTA